MSNLNSEILYETFSESIEFILEQFKKTLNTALPGIVQSYDATTKRAKVLPAIQRLFTDGTNQSLPVLIDVPVIFPAGGGFTITMPVKQGDSVLIIFSQRGLTNFKKQFQESLPTDSLLALNDAIAIPGFGGLSINPASSSGCSLQKEDGSNAVIVEDSKVEVKKGSNTVIIDDSQMQSIISGATLTLNASSLTCSVPIIAPSYSGPSGSAAVMTSGIDMSGQNITNGGSITGTDIIGNGVNLSSHHHIDSQGGQTGGPLN